MSLIMCKVLIVHLVAQNCYEAHSELIVDSELIVAERITSDTLRIRWDTSGYVYPDKNERNTSGYVRIRLGYVLNSLGLAENFKWLPAEISDRNLTLFSRLPLEIS